MFAQQVALEVEQEEDEAGTVGDTFTDYVSVTSLSITELVFVGNMTFLTSHVPVHLFRILELFSKMKHSRRRQTPLTSLERHFWDHI